MDIFKKFTLLTFALVSVSAFADAPGDEVESNNTSSDDVVESTVASEDTTSSSMNAAVDAGDGDVENVVVTGSKFAISQYKTSQPITIISGEEILRNNYTNAASALFDLPQISVSASTSGDQSGLQAGQRVANNFGLGSGRTLTLINGRRFVSSTPINYADTNTGAVDLNNIPVALIDRIEVLSAGGSAVYGSDAIAGVINYVLNREYTGFEVSVNSQQQYLGDIQNYDGEHALSLTMGGEFNDGKGHIVLAMQRDVQEAIYEGQLDRYRDCKEDVIYSRTFADGKTYQNAYTDASQPLGRGNGVPQGEIGMCRGLTFLPFEGAAADPYYWSNQNIVIGPRSGPTLGRHIFTPDGGVIPHDVGTSYGSSFFTYGGNSLSYNNNNTIQASLERENVSAFLTYELTDNTNFKLDMFRNSQFSSESGNTSGGPYFYLGFGGDLDGGYANPPYIACDYPYLNASGQEFCNDMGWGGMLVFKTLRDLYTSSTGGMTETDTTVDSLTASLDGKFEIADREMTWDVGFSSGNVFSLGTSEDIIRERIITATDVGINPNTGEIDCKMNYVDGYLGLTYGATNPWNAGGYEAYDPTGFGSAGLPGDCVPYNPIGYNPNQTAAADYIMSKQVKRSENKQDILFGSLSGSLYTLPAGDIQFSVGIEQRDESLEFWSDMTQNLKLTRSSVQPNNKVSYDTKENYLEIQLPIVDESMGLTKNGYGIKELRIDASRREIDNSFSGEYTVDAANVYWQVSDDIAVRGGTQNAVRTPDLESVFGPLSTAYRSGQDPCHTTNIDGGIYPATRRANCEAEPWWYEGWESKVVNRTETGLSGGNPNLRNELGETTTVGVIFTPTYDFIPGDLSIAFDIITIDITETVETFTLSQNMAGCYDYSPQKAKFCETFTRATDPNDPNILSGKYDLGDVNSFLVGPNNVGIRNFETHVINIDHQIETQWGDLSTRFRGYHQQKFDSAPTADPDDLQDFTGDWSEPEWLYDVTIGLSTDKHSVFYQVDGRSGGDIDKFQNMETQADKYIGLNGEVITEWDGYWTDSIAYLYTPTDNTSVVVNLSNPFDLDGDESRFPAEQNFRLSQTLNIGLRHKF
jgi:outer membrane receptor protein involved in Fe transport